MQSSHLIVGSGERLQLSQSVQRMSHWYLCYVIYNDRKVMSYTMIEKHDIKSHPGHQDLVNMEDLQQLL